MQTRPIPDGYHAVTPYLTVKEVPALIAFLKQAFGADVTELITLPNGSVNHAEARIRDSVIMMGEAPQDFKPMYAQLYLYAGDADAVYAQAIAAGGVSILEPHDEFYGDRVAAVKDPAGNTWWIATRVKTVPVDELQKLAAERFQAK